MTAPVLNYPISYASQMQMKPRILAARFGDGYEQRIGDGINTELEAWSIQANTLKSQAAQLEQFGAGDGAATQFQLTHQFMTGVAAAVYATIGAPQIYKSDWQGTQLQYPTARTNALKYSSQFDNAAWAKTGVLTVTPNAISAPDGTVTADLITDGDAANPSLISQFVAAYPAGTTVPCSIFVQQGTSTKSTFNCYATGDTETIAFITWSGGVPSVTLGTITSVGGGWYLWTINVTTVGTGAFFFRFWPCDRTVASQTGAIYVWGAQCGAAGSYIPTTAAAVTVTDYTLSSANLVTFANAPAIGATLSWSGTADEAGSFEGFLRAMGGVTPFTWTNPFGLSGLFVCKEWTRTPVYSGISNLTAKFEQVPA